MSTPVEANHEAIRPCPRGQPGRRADVLPGDVAVWDRWLDPAVLQVDENDTVRGKSEILKELQLLPKGLAGHLRIAEFRMTLAGDVAVVTHEDDESLDYFGHILWRRAP